MKEEGPGLGPGKVGGREPGLGPEGSVEVLQREKVRKRTANSSSVWKGSEVCRPRAPRAGHPGVGLARGSLPPECPAGAELPSEEPQARQGQLLCKQTPPVFIAYLISSPE